MASKPLLNKFKQLKLKLHSIKADLFFLKKCKENSVFPNFIKINCATTNSRTSEVVNKGKYTWLSLERKYLHSKLSNIELEMYSINKQIIGNMNIYEYESWICFLHDLETTVFKYLKRKKSKLHKKFIVLQQKQNTNKIKNKIQTIDNYVCNLSTTTLTNTELQLLQKGIHYTPTPISTNIQNTVVDIESAINYLSDAEKSVIRNKVKPILKHQKNKNKSRNCDSWSDIIKKLKSKDVHFIKADKGNKLVILNKSDYTTRMTNTLNNSSLISLTRNPINQMIKEANNAISQIENVCGIEKYKLKISNPMLPKCYGLPKIHKPGEKMRPIVSSINSPSYKIAKWLLSELNKFEPPQSLHIKNSFDVVDKLSDIIIKNDEIMVSFDVESLYPSIPIEETIEMIDDWLLKQNLPPEKIRLYKTLLKLCMNQNQFQFANKYYKQTSGTTMGNPLSCFVANTFMGNFETSLKDRDMLPRVWIRYVDDVFAVVKRDDLHNVLHTLNNQYASIKFTYETEINQTLPFLDILLERKCNKIEFNVYRKPTITDRYITSDSYCSHANKMAVFNSMVYRLCKLPLSVKNYIKELNYIKNVASINGFDNDIVNKLVSKHCKNIKRNEITSFFIEEKKNRNKKRAVFSYAGNLTDQLKNIFKKHNIDLVFTNNAKLLSTICNIKDKTDNNSKSGIYEISCKDCPLKYIGQTRRNILTRFKEHSAHIKYNQPEKSAVAQHVLDFDHFNINKEENLKLLKNVNHVSKLNAWESLYIHKNRFNLMNNDKGPIKSPLFYFT